MGIRDRIDRLEGHTDPERVKATLVVTEAEKEAALEAYKAYKAAHPDSEGHDLTIIIADSEQDKQNTLRVMNGERT